MFIKQLHKRTDSPTQYHRLSSHTMMARITITAFVLTFAITLLISLGKQSTRIVHDTSTEIPIEEKIASRALLMYKEIIPIELDSFRDEMEVEPNEKAWFGLQNFCKEALIKAHHSSSRTITYFSDVIFTQTFTEIGMLMGWFNVSSYSHAFSFLTSSSFSSSSSFSTSSSFSSSSFSSFSSSSSSSSESSSSSDSLYYTEEEMEGFFGRCCWALFWYWQ